ncbi:MAG: hypothetical protein NVSMB52_05150 [Chloroflexota bacterium]
MSAVLTNTNSTTTQRYVMSIDVGGTFTDFVLFDTTSGAAIAFHKLLTDPQQPAIPVIAGWRDILATVESAMPPTVQEAVHSTTLITNAIVERRGAKTVLLTTRGFRDVLEIGAEQMYDIFDLFAPYPPPLIPRHLRWEVSERVSRDGAVLEGLKQHEVRALLPHLAAEGVEAVAISFLHAYRNHDHEQEVEQIIASALPNIAVSVSSRVAPLVGEYERTSTVTADAYVKPLVRKYLSFLVAKLRDLGFDQPLSMVLSSGGITTAQAAMEYPIRLLESGPAAGAFAAGFYGQLTGHDDVLSLDMGGTTAKACLVEGGAPAISYMLEVDRVHRFKPGSGLPIMVPTIDLIEIGAGGGSIAHINPVGLINVGPQSAGAEPGPACYRRGGDDPTVTDANLLLGYLDPAYFLGGRMSLCPDLAEHAIKERIARPLGTSVTEAAWGIYAIVNETMAQAARTHIIERNRDPRDLVLVAFGGAGPAHALPVARILGISTVVVPLGAGVASAIGALTAPISLPFARSYMTALDMCEWSVVDRLFEDMEREARATIHGSTGNPSSAQVRKAVDLRFAGQYHELRIDVEPDVGGPSVAKSIETVFRARYAEVYGRVPSGLHIEALNWHLVTELPRRTLTLLSQPVQPLDHRTSIKGTRAVYFADPAPASRPCAVYDRYRLQPGMVFDGPCIIEEHEATVVVPPGSRVNVDEYFNIVVQVGNP